MLRSRDPTALYGKVAKYEQIFSIRSCVNCLSSYVSVVPPHSQCLQGAEMPQTALSLLKFQTPILTGLPEAYCCALTDAQA